MDISMIEDGKSFVEENEEVEVRPVKFRLGGKLAFTDLVVSIGRVESVSF